MIGYHWAWSLISTEHLDPTAPYMPVIYEKFAVGAVGMAAVALTIYPFEIMRKRP